jgi:arginine-tRNA-protein transferase
VLFDGNVTLINEEFHADAITPAQLDTLLADGWRHFGTNFFRYSVAVFELDIRRVIPLRIRLSEFSTSRSQRRVLRNNADVRSTIEPIEITDESIVLFERHKRRFKSGIPNSLYDFLSTRPSAVPCEALQVTVRLDKRLLAASYFDVGSRTVSAIYGMFDPDLPGRSLGIFTMLKVIEFAIESGKEFYYQGYAYEGSSFYDYKKRFRGTESYDWNRNWATLNAM